MFGDDAASHNSDREPNALSRLHDALEATRVAEAELLAALGEADAHGFTDIVDGLPTTQWMSRNGACSMSTARRRVRVARAARSTLCDDALERVAAGQVGADHLAVLQQLSNPRIEPDWSAMSGKLLDLAEHATFESWKREVANLARRLDFDGGYDPHADIAANRLRYTITPDALLVRGEFTGEHAELVRQAIDSEADAQFRLFSTDHQVLGTDLPSRPTLAALGLADLCRRGRLADAHGHSKPGTCEATLIIQQNDDDVRVFDEHGRLLTDSAVARMLCDPTLVALVTDSLGLPLDVGDRFRLATKAQRRALAARDGGCCMPGCDRPIAWTEAHHIDDWIRSHRTDLSNLAAFCRHHHGVIHRDGWSMRLGDDGWTIITKPDGTSMWGQRHGAQRSGPPPPEVTAG